MKDLEALLARSILLRWGARLFLYPDEALTDDLGSGRAAAQLTAALAALDADPPLSEAVDALFAALRTPSRDDVGLAEEYTFLFERDVHCPLYEASYREERSLVFTHDLAEISGFYGAFGVQVSLTHPDRPDHLSLELDFLSFLYAKQAYAVEQGWKRRGVLTSKARERFLQEHLAEWLPRFTDRLDQHARLGFYPAAARLAQAVLDSDRQPSESANQPGVPSHA